MNTCETCGERIVDHTAVCGAPQCCPRCCKEAEQQGCHTEADIVRGQLNAALDGVDPGKAGQDFISALFSAVKADLPAMILSSTESMKPCLLERVLDCRERDWRKQHKINTNPPAEPTEKVCPNCDGTGWSYHEHLPIERHVGCEDCGGCGDERGTGIIP